VSAAADAVTAALEQAIQEKSYDRSSIATAQQRALAEFRMDNPSLDPNALVPTQQKVTANLANLRITRAQAREFAVDEVARMGNMKAVAVRQRIANRKRNKG
jgi:hypothetical protein